MKEYWCLTGSDKQEVIWKVKDKLIGALEPLEQGKAYSITAEFESYCIDKENQESIKGYFLKVPQMKSCAIEVDSDYFYFLLTL